MKNAVVLSIDDDRNLQTVLSSYLEDSGYRVMTAHNGAEAEDRLSSAQVDAVLLDLGLPDVEGLNMIAVIRTKTSAPIIIVSGKHDTTEKIIGLEMGADDYITKPFELRELTARLKAVLRRTANGATAGKPDDAKDAGAEKINFGNWYLDRLQLQLFTNDNVSAELTTGEFRLLEALVLSPNRVLTRDFLFELTRDSEFDACDRAVDIQIGRIRKKMKSAGGDDSDVIKTVRGVGYMFSAALKKEAS